MEASGGVTVVGSDAPSDFHVAPRTENHSPAGGSAPAIPSPAATANQGGAPPQHAPYTAAVAAPPAVAATMPVKKKRGRPRKYAPDGSVVALSPKPISSSVPLPPVIDFSTAEKRGKVRPAGSSVSKARFEVENLGEWVTCSVGANFTPHFINVLPGEDITMKVMLFSQQGPQAICIMSANGVISSVTLRQPDSSGGTLTYEGRFEILSLCGSFMPNETGGPRSRSGGMSVALAGPDGRVIGGGVAGLLVAAGPVQVVVGSFLAGNQHEQNPRKQKHDIMSTVTPAAVVPISTADPVPILSSPSSFRGDSWSAMTADPKNKPADINVSLPGG